MVRKNGAQSIERAMQLLTTIIHDRCGHTLIQIASQLGLPPATAYRQAAALTEFGFLIAIGKGRYCPGPALLSLASSLSIQPVIAALARPVLEDMSRRSNCIAHLGVWDDDMVTYLVKAGAGDEHVFTQEGKQLEAYCSAIGKQLLAALPAAHQRRYLAHGPFIALTRQTITAPDALAAELAAIRAQGYACDREEVVEGMRCVAVGIPGREGESIAAISLTRMTQNDPRRDEDMLGPIRAAADEIALRLRKSGL